MKTKVNKFSAVMLGVLVLVFVLGSSACFQSSTDEVGNGSDSSLTAASLARPIEPDGSVEVVPDLNLIATDGALGYASPILPQIYGGTGQLTQGIVVSGEASMEVAPDIAIINLSVESIRDGVGEASDDVRSSVAQIVNSLEDAGVNSEDINTPGLQINLNQQWRDGELVLEGYRVSQSLRVTVRDLDIVPEVADAAIDAGGNFIRLSGISFTLDNPTPLFDAIRGEAAANAVRRAELYANGLGVDLGGPVYLYERSGGVPAQYDSYAAFPQAATLERADVSSLISPGDIVLRVTVEVGFSIQ